MTRARPAIAAALIAGLVLAGASPALADVKAGVDAWAAGDFPRAVAEWKTPAASGDADAQFNLAQAYRLGRGVPEDLKQAELLYARAASKGHLKAADNYGLLLFQDGRRQQAMPYVISAAGRGDPRAQYLVGIALFNGDLMAKDYVRAYALLTLANGAGLPQAAAAISQMDQYIPLEQRQQAQALAGKMRAEADTKRSTVMAAADLGEGPTKISESPAHAATGTPPYSVAVIPPADAGIALAPSSIAVAEAAVSEAMRATGKESPATAGADFARPAANVVPTRPANDTVQVARAEPGIRKAPPAGAAVVDGPWKLQLGAFALAGGADRLWAQLAGRSALAGKSKLTVPAGRLTRLLASGWPSEAAAQSACNALKAAGQGCLVTR